MFKSLFSCGDAVTLPKLVMELQGVKGQYRRLGIRLCIHPSQIDAWEKEYWSNADTILEKIIGYLLDNKGNPLEVLCSALDDIDQTQLAKRLRNIYGIPQGMNLSLYLIFVAPSLSLAARTIFLGS